MKKIVMIITCFVLINLMIYPINANALYEDYTLVDEIKYKENPISLFGADLEKDDNTASKEFYLRLMQNNGDKRKFIVIFNNKWTTLPVVRTFDLIGFAYDGLTFDGAIGGTQTTDKKIVHYTYPSDNLISRSNGIAYAMNLVDNATSISNEVIAELYATSSNAKIKVCGSYQHARKATTLAQAKSVYFSMNGMGNVFEIPSNLSGYYDNTPGLCLEYQI